MPRKKQVKKPLEELIPNRYLAMFLRAIISEEKRLRGSVPGWDCRQTLKMYCFGTIQSESQLRRLMNRIVEEGLITEDRKDMKFKVVGYSSTTAALNFIVNQGVAHTVKTPANLPIKEIIEMAKQVPKPL